MLTGLEIYSLWDKVFSLPSGLLVYFFLEWYLHATAAHGIGINEKGKYPFPWKMYLLRVLSVGYAFSHYFKGKSEGERRKQFIEKCNLWNWTISLILMMCSFGVISADLVLLIPFLQGINGYRFISRSLEIIWAFGFDIVHKPPYKSNLNRYERLRLALMSYFEIYIYSASFYVTIIHYTDDNMMVFKSIMMSLSVGTLTNIAYSQNDANLSHWLQLFPFVQVMATLSLVVLGLAIYVSQSPES